MLRKELSKDRFTEIKRQLDLKIPVIKIAENQKCTERAVRLIRDGVITAVLQRRASIGPLDDEPKDGPRVGLRPMVEAAT